MSRQSLMHLCRPLLPFLLAVSVLTCADPEGPNPSPADFGTITVLFQGQSLAFGGGLDSAVGYYMPESGLLTVTGTVPAGLTPSGRFFLVLDSVPARTTGHFVTRTAPYLTIAFDHPTDSTLVYPYTTLRTPTDRVTLEKFDLSTCEARGTFRTVLHYGGEGPGYEVVGTFWGRFTWNAVPPRPC